MFHSPFKEIFGAFLMFSGLYVVVRMPVRKERRKSEALRLLEFAVIFFLGRGRTSAPCPLPLAPCPQYQPPSRMASFRLTFGMGTNSIPRLRF